MYQYFWIYVCIYISEREGGREGGRGEVEMELWNKLDKKLVNGKSEVYVVTLCNILATLANLK